jgi:hypothetical protein
MEIQNRIIWILVLVILTSLFGFHPGNKQDWGKIETSGNKLVYLPLEGEIANRYAEISSLTWYEDQLILLPQYPDRFSSDNFSLLFRIPKKEIRDYLNQDNPSSKLSPQKIEFDEKEIPDRLPGFQGYESIVFVGKRIFLTIEVNLRGSMPAFLVEGTISDNMERIVLDESSLDSLPMPTHIKNFAYEAMINAKDKLLILYEANGANLYDTPQMIDVNLKSGKVSSVPFLNLEYRITDATDLDEKGCFWVINYFYPGDYGILDPAADQLEANMKPTLSYSRDTAIERLVELKYTSDGIKFSGTPPIVLGNEPDSDSRNWEGIVRLENLGFILATDKHPKTILAFMPY